MLWWIKCGKHKRSAVSCTCITIFSFHNDIVRGKNTKKRYFLFLFFSSSSFLDSMLVSHSQAHTTEMSVSVWDENYVLKKTYNKSTQYRTQTCKQTIQYHNKSPRCNICYLTPVTMIIPSSHRLKKSCWVMLSTAQLQPRVLALPTKLSQCKTHPARTAVQMSFTGWVILRQSSLGGSLIWRCTGRV